MDQRLERLLDLFRQRGPVAVAFSGGVDSTLTLWAAARALGAKALGVSIRSEFICRAERERAERMAAFLAKAVDARVAVRSICALSHARLRGNPPDRCYLCKQLVLAEVRAEALAALGAEVRLADGTNADDDPARPGLRAVAEAGAFSPLALCGIDKAGVRELARRLGLPNAEDPSNSCLATRVPTGAELTFARLTAIEGLERAARDLGLEDLRARLVPGPLNAQDGDAVRLLVRPEQLVFAQGLAQTLEERARFIGFTHFALGERT